MSSIAHYYFIFKIEFNIYSHFRNIDSWQEKTISTDFLYFFADPHVMVMMAQ